MCSSSTQVDPDVSLGTLAKRHVLVIAARPDVSRWSVGRVTSMWGCSKAVLADPDVRNWDVSAVTNMAGMFRDATSANPNVSNWDVRSVTSMGGMFSCASEFNGAPARRERLECRAVTDMSFMFAGAHQANPDVAQWDTSNVTNTYKMFHSNRGAQPDVTMEYHDLVEMGSMFFDAN